ncbi:hypothetical protein H5410_026562 [Solanum commersonii]|uniref:Uncharacterized protein n=1 Tax=Solanum commersonii TaxID=4109 RepID=A0A9J5Z1V7_SOLCO|nr:hypothetical protein H5410_026562 [Solanum commersonii]
MDNMGEREGNGRCFEDRFTYQMELTSVHILFTCQTISTPPPSSCPPRRSLPPSPGNFWCVWNERNHKCFDEISTPSHTLKARCLANLFSWNFLSPANSADSFLDFVSSLILT